MSQQQFVPQDPEDFAERLISLMFGFERQGEWMGDIVDIIENNNGVVDPDAIARELARQMDGVDGIIFDIEAVIEDMKESI